MTLFSRRSILTAGAAVLGTAAITPTAWAETTTPAQETAQIDAAFDMAIDKFRRNGSPTPLEISLFQPLTAINSTAADVYINLKNLTDRDVNFTSPENVRIDLAIRANRDLDDVDQGRAITGFRTSWGDRSLNDSPWVFSNKALPATSRGSQPISDAAHGTVHHTASWRPLGLLAPGQEADCVIGFGDGITRRLQRWTNYIDITPARSAGVGELQMILGPSYSAEASSYYEQRLSALLDQGGLITWLVRGPFGEDRLRSGQTVSSFAIGNWCTTNGNESRDGIW